MTTRISKIARLPKPIREQLNQRLENGEIGRTILPWLNDLPETKKVLAELFAGKPVTHQNLSEWRRGGHLDWLAQQQRLEWFDRLAEHESDLKLRNEKFDDPHEAMGSLFLFEIGQRLAALRNIKNPEASWTRLQQLTREFARLQNAYNWSRRVQLEWEKFNEEPCPEEPDEPCQPTEDPQAVHEDEEDDEEYYTEDEDDEIGGNDEAEEIDDVANSSGTGVPPVSPCSHESIPRAIVDVQGNVAPQVQAEQMSLSAPLGAPASRRPDELPASIVSDPSAARSPAENLNPATAFQPIPPLAPTTPTLPSPPARPHISPNPIRGRRFVCIEG